MELKSALRDCCVACSVPSQELVGIKLTSLTVTSVSDLTVLYVIKERKSMAQYCLMFRDLPRAAVLETPQRALWTLISLT